MKMKNILTLLAVAVMLPAACGGTFTNLVLSSIQNQAVTNSFTLGTNQVAKIINQSGDISGTGLAEVIAGVRILRGFNGNWTGNTFYGPAKIEFYMPYPQVGPDGTYTALLTFEINPTGTDLPIVPSNAVVIPADSAGPVTILLESSADLVTWNAAVPGTYGTSTTNRFFRVRGIRN